MVIDTRAAAVTFSSSPAGWQHLHLVHFQASTTAVPCMIMVACHCEGSSGSTVHMDNTCLSAWCEGLYILYTAAWPGHMGLKPDLLGGGRNHQHVQLSQHLYSPCHAQPLPRARSKLPCTLTIQSRAKATHTAKPISLASHDHITMACVQKCT